MDRGGDPRRDAGVHLLRTDDRLAEADAFVAVAGRRVGLAGVLDDLDRRARTVTVPAPAASWGFRWDAEDTRSPRWWPQGISTHTGAAPGEERPLLVTSAYAHELDGVVMGARLSFVDVSDPSDVRYRHVLLVEPFLRDDGAVDVRPVVVHAGGIVWHGDHVHVAGTTRGFSSFHLDDITQVPTGDASRMRVRTGSPSAVDTFGHRYVLPVRFTYAAQTAHGTARMRYSFASLDQSTEPAEMVVGEYGRSTQTNRLARFPLDPATGLLHAEDGRTHPSLLSDGGVPGMQGATVVDGTWFVTTSRGRFRLGSVWVGRPGELREHRHQLPVGPEDIAYWPERDELWSLSEYPGNRFVYAMPRAHFLPR